MNSDDHAPLKLVLTTRATTYTFRADNGCRWACATVNDSTNELSIQSDFGNWSYRWGGSGFGGKRPGYNYNLTGFIGERGSGDYLADKLCKKTDEFSSELTIRALRRKLCEKRLESGRDFTDYYREEDPEDIPEDWEIDGSNKPRYLTKTAARGIWRSLGRLDAGGCRSADIFIDRYNRSDNYENFTWWLTDEPWNHLEYEPSYPYQVLRDEILPALIEACREVSDAKNP